MKISIPLIFRRFATVEINAVHIRFDISARRSGAAGVLDFSKDTPLYNVTIFRGSILSVMIEQAKRSLGSPAIILANTRSAPPISDSWRMIKSTPIFVVPSAGAGGKASVVASADRLEDCILGCEVEFIG